MERAAPLATFATELRRYRQAAGLTQEELAERAHLSVRGIADLERGARRAPRKETVQLLAEALALEAPIRAAFEAAARRQVQTGRDPLRAADGPAHARAVDPARSNLPLLRTSFVGRAREQAVVERLLATTGLVTLTGAGGCGKTRLALQVAAALQPSYPDGVWLVELAALSDAALVPQAVANVLGVRERPGQPLLAGLTGFLRPRHLLLVLDNCEHLVAACAGLVDTLLRVCPRLTILATSREAVDVAGERLWKVPSLALPMPHTAPGVIEAGEAVQFFAEHARAAREGFALTERNAGVVAQICRRVDGMPLAIELAAARLASISLEQLAARLDDRFRLLTGGNRTALPRQQTLRATLDWSYDLLGEEERILLRRLSVFAGAWTLEAAESICAGDDIGAEGVLDLLAGLVNKSLVALDEGGGDTRYWLLETVRQYGHEKLLAAGEAGQVRDRHLDWYLRLAVQAAPALTSHEQAIWLERLELELENLRASLTWAATEVAQQEKGVQLAESVWIWWYTRGHVSEGRRRLEDLLAHGDGLATAFRARALVVLGQLT